jgi:hypothetical protein
MAQPRIVGRVSQLQLEQPEIAGGLPLDRSRIDVPDMLDLDVGP